MRNKLRISLFMLEDRTEDKTDVQLDKLHKNS